MPFFEKSPVRLHYEEAGAGFPLLLIPGGGQNSALSMWGRPFNAFTRYQSEYRCISADLRNANTGQSTGPLEVERPWDSYTDDHLALMDHLGVDKFAVMGFCIGGSMVWNLLKRAPERVVAAAIMQPIGFFPEQPMLFVESNMKGWGPKLVERRPDITIEQVEAFLTNMYARPADFVFSVSRDFVRSCKTPILMAPDDVPVHPYAAAVEAAELAPNSETTIFPWKDTPEHIEEAAQHADRFLKTHAHA